MTRAETAAPEPGAPRPAGRRRLVLVVAGILGGVLLFQVLSRSFADFAAEEVGLGRNTVAFTAERDGRQVAGPFRDLAALYASFAAVRAEGRPVVLWLGASQLYAINHPQPGQQTAVWHAAEACAARGSNTAWIQCASPNSNPHELLAMYLGFRRRGLVPDRLVLGVTYDDLKEPGLRSSALLPLLPVDAPERELLGSLGAPGEDLLAALEGDDPTPGAPDGAGRAKAPVERSATSGTPQERLENALTGWLEDHWQAYADRGPLRAAVVTAWKMPVTTLAFRVFARPQTPVPPAMQAWNEPALWALIELALRDGVPVMAYKAPHHPGLVPFFHPRAAYDAWHEAFAARCAALGVDYVDLETLVPGDLWGETNNFAPDVFHFREQGHVLLGRAVDAELARWGDPGKAGG